MSSQKITEDKCSKFDDLLRRSRVKYPTGEEQSPGLEAIIEINKKYQIPRQGNRRSSQV